MFSCNDCGTSFGREDNLKRHMNYHCKGTEWDETCEPKQGHIRKSYKTAGLLDSETPTFSAEIPTFDGDEFCGNKPLTRPTLNRIMKMMNMPEDRWDRIATAELLEQRKRQ